MKKVLMFICSLLIVLAGYTISSGVVGALDPTKVSFLEPTEAKVRDAHEHLKALVLDPEHSVCHDDDACLLHMDALAKEHLLGTKTFSQVCDVYNKELKNCLSVPGQPIKLNCHAFASYAFKQYRERSVNCQYLRIFFDGMAKMSSGEDVGFVHDVVLVPQIEGGITRWYVCDFHNAMVGDKLGAVLLFVPLTVYLSGLNESKFGHIKEMMIIPDDDPLFFAPSKCLDARIWFCEFGNSEAAALDIIRFERDNGLMMDLKIGALLSERCQEYTYFLQSLYNKVDPDMAKRCGEEVNRRILDMIRRHPQLRQLLQKQLF